MQNREITIKQISPCGVSCVICMAYLRKENSCPGCREENKNKPYHCARCRIKNCDEFKNNDINYCYECSSFPCKRMKQLDNSYRNNYNFSMIENLENIKNKGIEIFIEDERKRWTCSKCGGIISVHRGYCSICGEIKFYHKGTNRAKIK